MTPAQQEASDEELEKEEARTALDLLYQLHAPHLDEFLHPARVAFEKLLRNGWRT